MPRLAVALVAALLMCSVEMPPAAGQAATGASAAPDAVAGGTRAERLDALFGALRTAGDVNAARRAEQDIFEIWLQSGSDTVDLLMDWTLAAIDEENYPLALDFLDRITTLEPNYVEGWNKRATVHFMNDDIARSIADLEQVLAIEPRHFGALAGLGTVLSELGDDALALAAYREALALDPFMEDVQEAIEKLEAQSGGQDI